MAILRGTVQQESATRPCPGPLECSLTFQNLLFQHYNQLNKVRLSAFPTKTEAQCTAALTCSYFGQYKKFPPGNTVEEHAQNDVTISAS